MTNVQLWIEYQFFLGMKKKILECIKFQKQGYLVQVALKGKHPNLINFHFLYSFFS